MSWGACWMVDCLSGDAMDAQFGDLGKSMSDESISTLWLAAADITPCVAEQTWLVTMCIRAGKDAEWLSLWMDEVPYERGIFGEPGP